MKLNRITLVSILLLVTNVAYSQQHPWHPEDENYAESCTSIMVGKKASTDGSVMTAHSCDSNYRTWLTMEERKRYKEGEMEPIYWGALHTEEPNDTRNLIKKGEIPTIAQTYRFLNVAYPCLNEKQLAMGETTTVGKRELRNKDGLFLIEELERVALQRCSTARDAIRLMGSLAEEYGFGDYGECLTVADKNEVWHFEIYGTGTEMDKPGALWVAQRIPDDHVGISANIPRIGVVNFNNPNEFMYASDIKERTKEMGLWDGKSEFKFYKMVSNGKPFSYREYWVFNKLAPSLGLKFEDKELPFSIKPDKKVSPEEMFNFYRETYEGSEWDMSKNLFVEVPRKRVNKEGKTIKYKDTIKPISNFMPADLRALLIKLDSTSTKYIRSIAVIQCSYSHIIQLRDWLPDAVGGIAYFSFDNPAQSPRIPIYAGATQLPKGFDICGQHRYREDAAIWSYRESNRISTINWSKTRDLIEENVNYYQNEMMNEAPIFEKRVKKLIKDGKDDEATILINNYTQKYSAATSKTWEDLKAELWTYFIRSM